MSFLDTLTDFFEDTKDTLTDFVEDARDVLSDFLESAGTITYGNYGGLNYSAGVMGGTITETSPPPVNAYDAAFICTTLFTKVLPTQQCVCQQTSNLQKP